VEGTRRAGRELDLAMTNPGRSMNHRTALTVTSLLSILLFSLHVADDIVRGFEPGTTYNLPTFPIFVVWMYGTIMLAERRSGYVIMLLGSLLSMAVPILHLKGRGIGVASGIASSEDGYFFVWTVLAIGTTALFSAILSVQGLWSLRRVKPARAMPEA
jgi:hypothetical protein